MMSVRATFALSRLLPALAGGSLALLAPTPCAGVRLPALVGDHMVLQRGMRAPVWGWGAPGETVIVSVAGQTRRTAVAADGRWRVRLAPLRAGGPFEMRISAPSGSVTLHDVMIGDVWVASGQSNMTWTVGDSLNGAAETAAADWPAIRLFQTPHDAAPTPRDDCAGAWGPCTPATARGFSGVAYFFGRELHRKLGTPIGLIQSDVGGTPAESWIDPACLRTDPAFADLLLKVPPAGAPAGHARYEQTMHRWYLSILAADPGNRGEREGWMLADAPGDWRPMQLPGAWETNTPSLQIDGGVWFRRTVTIPSEWAGRDLIVSLGPIGDHDTTYFDGQRVGSTVAATPLPAVRRAYRVPGRLVHSGARTIAVRVVNQIAAGGLTGRIEDMRLAPAEGTGEAIPLAGEWQFRIEFSRDAAAVPPMPPPPADEWTAWSTGGLYNAMVAPLTRCGIRGVIWYQGESNAGRAAQYQRLFPALIRCWRTAWGQGDFPFIFVQLANYMPRNAAPAESPWAELREAQTAALALPRTAMAAAIDLGEAADIHPKNKQDVGARLALAARAVAYGERALVCSGPVFCGMERRGGSLTLHFRNAAGGLRSRGERLSGFAVAGRDGKFVWAAARILGETVVVSSPDVREPMAVRYGWAENPDCGLYGATGLPAVPFRTDRPAAVRAGGARH